MSAIRHPPDVLFLDECRLLSNTARALLAALVLERFCAEQNIDDPQIDAFLDHHWAWLDVLGHRREFFEWEGAAPALRDGAAHEYRLLAMARAVSHVLFASFYGAEEDEPTFASLQFVVDRAQLSQLPPVTPFKFSPFRDRGRPVELTDADAAYWRSLRHSYARAPQRTA